MLGNQWFNVMLIITFLNIAISIVPMAVGRIGTPDKRTIRKGLEAGMLLRRLERLAEDNGGPFAIDVIRAEIRKYEEKWDGQ